MMAIAASGTHGVEGRLITEWGAGVTPENAWRDYPRPQMVREHWRNLNGNWEYAVTPESAGRPDAWDGTILVPFCLESQLSGVGRLLQPEEALWYRRLFHADPVGNDRCILHFEAVDYETKVWVNGAPVGSHTGGNTPFAFDITDALQDGDNELVVKVTDDTGGYQLRGKQAREPRGIIYTRVSGIWQTVWLETVPASRIDSLKLDTRIDPPAITVRADVNGASGHSLRVVVSRDGDVVAEAIGDPAGTAVPVPGAELWHPDHPALYDLDVELLDADGAVLDSVRSYAGIREVGKVQDEAGHWRMTLNGQIIFHWGILDQGWWPDGLLTPPSDEAMLADIEFIRDCGFNMIRCHIKVNPRRFYLHCDRLGMMVWQDQVSALGVDPEWTKMAPNPVDAEWPDDAHRQFMMELKRMIDLLYNSPAIVSWIPFNERWGQHRTMDVGAWTAAYDPSRLINIASGGNFWPVGDVADHHAYPHPDFPLDDQRFDDYIKVVGEFGGHGFVIGKEHLWNPDSKNWGYGGLPETHDELRDRFRKSIDVLLELKEKGIAGGVYTQTTDVEGEVNGLMTYDRKVKKISPEELTAISAPLLK